MTWRRLLAAAALGAVWLRPAVSFADAPRQQGWWTATLAPPDVPDDGLLVEGGVGSTEGEANASPGAFAALVYDVPSGAEVGTLTLQVAPSSATTPNTTLQLCPLATADIEPAQGGAMTDAPAFACDTNVTAPPSSDGATYEFDVESLVADGVLAVAVLPTTPAGRVVLSAPDGDSLAVEAAPRSGGFDTGSSTVDDGAGVVATPSPESYGSSLPTAPAPAPSPAIAGETGVPVASSLPRSQVALAAGAGDDSESDTSAALLLVVAGGAGLLAAWLAVGRAAAQRAVSSRVVDPEGAVHR